MSALLDPNAKEAAASAVSSERQIVAMNVGGEVYGVGIDLVHTVILFQPITAVPRTPEHVKGIINLRGRVVPIIDLRTRFGLPVLPADRQKDVRIVMVDVDGQQTGMIVDGVSEVLRLPASCFETPSEFVSSESAYVDAIARAPMATTTGGTAATSSTAKVDSKSNERLILMLDVRKVIHGTDDAVKAQLSAEALTSAA